MRALSASRTSSSHQFLVMVRSFENCWLSSKLSKRDGGYGVELFGARRLDRSCREEHRVGDALRGKVLVVMVRVRDCNGV